MKLDVKDDATQQVTISLDGNKASIAAGGEGRESYLTLSDKTGKTRLFFGSLSGHLIVGGNGAGGDISVHPSTSSSGVFGELPSPTIVIHGDKGEIELRAANKNVVMRLSGGAFPKIEMMNSKGEETVHLSAAFASLTLGGKGEDGTIIIKDQSGNQRINLIGDQGAILLKDNAGKGRVTLLGNSGDIVIDNADCAEDFDIAGVAEPGTVMIIADDLRLRESTEPYDKRVAGVISGAGDSRPGIVLGRKQLEPGRLPIALVGKVYCRTDATFGAIGVGDLLTTSPVPGYAMKASEPAKAFGAVLGKALQPLDRGRDLIPILVALQ